METQLKIYEKFANSKFEIIIVDNSQNDEEWRSLQNVCDHFSFPLKVIKYGTPGKGSSESHGEGLQYIYNLIKDRKDIDYFLTQDPDFFWVKPDFLKFIEDKMLTFTTVGAPYHFAYPIVDGGHPWFPAAFGCSYRWDMLTRISANFRALKDNSGIEKDVGWQVRCELSKFPYLNFEQESFVPKGEYSFEMIPRKYIVDGETIAYHMHRGSFEVKAKRQISWTKGRIQCQNKIHAMQAPQEWQENRKKMCDFFWKEISLKDKS